MGLATTWLLVFVATVIVWLMWQHAAQAALIRVRPGARFTPGWAVGWWLIPVANLWKPYQAIRELWAGTNTASILAGTRTWLALPAWWMSWLLFSAIWWWNTDRSTAVTLIRGDAHDAISVVPGIVSSVLAIIIIRAISDGIRARSLGPGIPFPAPPRPPGSPNADRRGPIPLPPPPGGSAG